MLEAAAPIHYSCDRVSTFGSNLTAGENCIRGKLQDCQLGSISKKADTNETPSGYRQ